MWQFIGIRVLQGIFTLLVISLLVFLATRLTGDPALVLLPPEASSKADYERVRKQLGLDKSLPEQYFIFLRGAVQGDFGLSIRDRRPTRDLLLERLPATLQLAMAGMALAIIIGVPLGILSAVKRDSIFDKGGKLFAVLGMAAPQFWVAIMLILLFGAILKLLPTYGREGPENFILPSFVLAWVDHGRNHAAGTLQHAGSAGQRLRAVRANQGVERRDGGVESTPCATP